MPEPSHNPCPMCGHSDDQEQEYYIQDKLQRAIDNLKFLNLYLIGNDISEKCAY